MPKIKTHKGAKRRFHISGTGKIMRRKGSISHLRRRMSPAAKRQSHQKLPVAGRARKHVGRLLPYGLP